VVLSAIASFPEVSFFRLPVSWLFLLFGPEIISQRALKFPQKSLGEAVVPDGITPNRWLFLR
jgi:hypothetical protein